jgi:hypothetical protein
LTKKIAIYGRYKAKVPVKQRYWKKRIDGVRQRYWKKTKRMRKATIRGRYELHGTGRTLYKAIALIRTRQLVPKAYRRFVDVSATKFLEHPEEYSDEGSWIESEVES